jgi:hypothetical protein
MWTADAIRGLRTWVTSEYEHDGLRVSAGAVLDRLIGMCRGQIPPFCGLVRPGLPRTIWTCVIRTTYYNDRQYLLWRTA